MLAEFFASGGCGDRPLCALRRGGVAFEIVLENVFGGTRLAGDFAKAQEERLSKASAVDGEDADGLLFGGALKNHGVEIGDAAREFGAEAQRGIEFLDALV